MKLDETNYLTWSKFILIYIQGKDNEDYLMGKMEAPPKNDPQYMKWKIENAMVMGWLSNSMKPEISEHDLFLETTHQIWESL